MVYKNVDYLFLKHKMTNKVVFCLSLSLVCYVLLAGWKPRTLPFPLVVFPLLIGSLILILGNRVYIPQYWIHWFSLLMIMFIWCLFVDLVNNTLQANIKRYVAFIFVTIFAILCVASVHCEDQIRLLFLTVVCATALSATVAVLQLSPYREPFLALWRWRYMTDAPKEAIPRLQELYTFILGGRAAGMSPYSLTLAHQIVAVLPLGVGLLMTERQKGKLVLIVLCFIALILGALATGARIAMFIGLISVVVTLLWIWGPTYTLMGRYHFRFRFLLVVFTLSIPVLVFLFVPLSFHKLRLLTPGESQRLETWLSVIALLSKQPQVLLLGLGGGEFSDWGLRIGVLGSSHNQFLGALIEYGLIGLLLLLCFYYKTFYEIYNLGSKRIRSNTYEKKILPYKRCCIVSLLAYVISSQFHDQGPLTADIFHLMLISVFITIKKLRCLSVCR